jgi:hypothetical protein
MSDNDTILIIKEAGGGHTVVVGGLRYADGLAKDECLGVVASVLYTGNAPYVRSPRDYANELKRRTEQMAKPESFDFTI